MAEDDDDRPVGAEEAHPSLDPRTWLKSEPATEAATFNPKSWIERPRATTPRHGVSRNRRWLMISGVAVVTGGGAGAVWLSGFGTSHDRAARKPASGLTRDFDADGYEEIELQLVDYRVRAQNAAAVAESLRRAIGDEHSSLHVVAVLAQSGDGAYVVDRLTARQFDGAGVRLTPRNGGFVAEALRAKVDREICATELGQMTNGESFHSAAAPVMQDDALIAEFTRAMAFDFNFSHDLTDGARFQARLEQERGPEGRLIGAARLVYAQLDVPAFRYMGDTASDDRSVEAKSRRLYRYKAPLDAAPGWYDETGRSAVRSLMRTPLDVVRVTSKFGMRIHPLDNVEKQHKGVDFACQPGTAIYASADGVVARKDGDPTRGYGYLLVLKHTEHLQTFYAHLERYKEGLQVGSRVAQGEIVAYSGATGHVTGPHLHYEIREDGMPKDPLTYVTKESPALVGNALAAFLNERDRIDAGGAACAAT